jgi:hypothetical protein
MFNNYLVFLNENKFFTGIMMLLLNIGSRYVELNISDSMESFIKMNIARELIIFSIAWMGTRDIVTSFLLTAAFIILSDFILNTDSKFCILSNKYRYLKVDKNKDGIISDSEINNAIKILEKAKKQKVDDRNRTLLNYYDSY